MLIADNIIRNKLRNVYFIWGRGKTTIANKLYEKHGFYIYSTDESRSRHYELATPENQPTMCRDYEQEYGVKSFWEIPAEVIVEREKGWLCEMTPMIIADLIELASQHKVIICEGDIDYDLIMTVASHAVHLQNCGTAFDWFSRPDHEDIRKELKSRDDLTGEEKEAVVANAYAAITANEPTFPEWVTRLGVKNIIWNDETRVEQTVSDVEKYFDF